MALKTKVKVGNITNLSDARYCSGMGVDLLGFPFGALDFKTYQDIIGWVTGPQFVVEIGMEAASLTDISEKFAPDFIEIDAAFLSSLPAGSQKYIVRMPLSLVGTFEGELLKNKGAIEYILLTESSGDANLDTPLIQSLSNNFSVLIGYDVSISSLPDLLLLPIAGINLLGSDELKPGLKDYDHLASILESLED